MGDWIFLGEEIDSPLLLYVYSYFLDFCGMTHRVGMFGYLDDSMMFEKVGNFYDTFIIFHGTCIHRMMSASCCN